MATMVLACILGLYGFVGLTDIDPGEVGLLVKKLGDGRGMQKRTLDTGIHWVEPVTYDTPVYDTRLRQEDFPDTPSTTKDGQPINIDVSAEIGLVDKNVPYLHENVGKDYYYQVIMPALRSVLRTTTSKQMSDEVYTGEGRERMQQQMEEALRTKLEPLGIRISINLRKIEFLKEDFITVLETKAKAAQQITIEERKAAAAKNIAIRTANLAEGEKQKRIKAAEADREERRLKGEGDRLQKEEQAKGILAVATAEAEGVRLRRQALSGAGGKELVSIEWAKHLGPNVKVYGIPTGAPGTSSIMDLNGILQGALKGPGK